MAVPCQDCGSTGRPIVYGIPTAAQKDAADLGEVTLGRCAIPTWPTCPRCGHRVEQEPSRMARWASQLRRAF
jgi:hypothetical protein